MMADAALLASDGPVAIRYPRGRARQVAEHEVGSGLAGRRLRRAGEPAETACVIAIGKLVAAAERAAIELGEAGIDVTVWDARCCAPLDAEMLADAARHRAVITVEDGVVVGGIGSTIAVAGGRAGAGHGDSCARHARPVHRARRKPRRDPRHPRPGPRRHLARPGPMRPER